MLSYQIVTADDKDTAMSLFFSGKDAYNSGNYEAAQAFFQEALYKDENIEAKAQNIKYMLGVSAFNNRDYKTAKTYLMLFDQNPIAKDLLEKIEQYEKTLPEDFLYNNDPVEKQNTQTATQSDILSTEAENKNTATRTTIIIIVTTLVIMSVSVFFEIKKSLFSQIALKLVGVSSDSVVIRMKEKQTQDVEALVQSGELTESGEQEINTASLLETPFDEEIDIEKMASKDIKEISRFFDEESEDEFIDHSDEIENEPSVEPLSQEAENEENESARDSILNSILDDENEVEPSDIEAQEIMADDSEEPISQDKPSDELQDSPVSKKPKYEHLDNVPDDFNVNETIEKAFKMIEETSRMQDQSDETNEDNFKTIEELEKEMEEKEKISLGYFQEMENFDKDNLSSFFDYVFDQHLEESKK